MQTSLLVSIVTPSFNQVPYLPELLRSVHEQDYPHIEHVVVDGGSTDGTLEILKETTYPVKWISEADAGQAAAINKGMAMAGGDILGWVNCDDALAPGAIRAVVGFFRAHPRVMMVYGDAMAIDESGRRYGLRTNVRPTNLDDLVNLGDFIVQPAAFWRAELWKEIGCLDEQLRYMLDYEYWMRVARRHAPVYLPLCLAMERLHVQSKTAGGYHERMQEIELVARRHGGKGLPYHFRAEAALLLVSDAFRKMRNGDFRDGFAHMRNAIALKPALLKFTAFLLWVSLFGLNSISRLRLVNSSLRVWSRLRWPKIYNSATPRS